MLLVGRNAFGSIKDTGWRDLGTFTAETRAGEDVSWINPGNAAAADAVDATGDLTTINQHQIGWLQAVDMQGDSVPSTALIFGIHTRVLCEGTNDDSCEMRPCKIVKGGVISGTDQGTILKYPDVGPATQYFPIVLGSSSSKGVPPATNDDLWGLTWTPAEINAADFGWAMSGIDPDELETDITIDHMQIKVFYID